MCDKWSCTGGRLLAHPPSQDILTSEQHNLIMTDICECTWELQTLIQCDVKQTTSKHVAGYRDYTYEQ
jgi:hypothetical protein